MKYTKIRQKNGKMSEVAFILKSGNLGTEKVRGESEAGGDEVRTFARVGLSV